MPKNKYKYDIAISFAGENRKIAENLATLIKTKDKGLSVFYDKDHKAYLWGKDAKEFDNIYGPDSRYVIPIISEHYTKKDWPRYEFSVAAREAKKRKREFILPIRVDDARLVGLHDDLNYMDIREEDIGQIAEAVVTKCQDLSKMKIEQEKYYGKASILSRNSREALGIIATCVFPTELVNLGNIFPNIKWGREVSLLSRKGLVIRKKQHLKVPKEVKNTIIKNPRDAKEFNLAWINALELLKDHPDIAIMLSLHYLHLDNFDQAIQVSTDLVEGMDSNWLSGIYLAFFKGLIRKERSINIKTETRTKLYNAMGLCLSHTGKYAEAVKWFLKLRRFSLSHKNTWGIGQSYINCGVAYQKFGDFMRANTCYVKAIKHARAAKDGLLLSHSLNNLAYITANDSLAKAEELIKESISVKIQIKDHTGLLASYGTLGYLAACEDEFKKARKWFLKSQKKANALGLNYVESTALFNLGNVYFELGQFDSALSCYRQSYVIAEKHNYPEIAKMAIECEAKTYFEKGWFRKAELRFRKLYDMEKPSMNDGLMLDIFDGIGTSLLKQKKFIESRKILQKALKPAYKLMNLEMIIKLSTYKALTYSKGTLGQAAIKILERDAANNQKSEKYLVALKLWITCIAQLINLSEDANRIEMALHNGIYCLKNICNSYEVKIKLYTYLHIWQWHKKDFQASIKTLQTVEKIAVKGQLWEDQAKAIDQRGVCLQELGKLDEAESLHQESLSLARKIKSNHCIQTSLNNLGEIYRKTNRHTKAINTYKKAEQVANQIKDYENEIATTHNRALVLEDKGKFKETERLLSICQNRSKRLHFGREYARSWEALGNLAWNNENFPLAIRRFKKALLEAKIYKQYELQPEIALNLARILLYQGKDKEGLHVLEPYEKTFLHITDSFGYYDTLAKLYEKNNRLDLAEKNYILAKESANNIGNKDRMAYFCSALTELYKKQKQSTLSDTDLKKAINTEKKPKKLACLLLQRFDLLLRKNKEKLAEQVFQEAKSLMVKHSFKTLYIDIHMTLGDHNWKENYKSKFNAMQAYIVALGECFLHDMKSSAEIGSHIIDQLIWKSGKSAEILIDKMEKDITQWLLNENHARKSVVQCLLWPLRAARKMYPFRLKLNQLEKITKYIIEEETLALSNVF